VICRKGSQDSDRLACDGRREIIAPAVATEQGALDLAAEVAQHPPEAVARLKRMLHDWDRLEERSVEEGRGLVEWQRSGPGLPFRD